MTGDEVFAGYRLEARIGVGGMAEVFRASRLGPDGFAKQVALKRVLPDLARDPRFVAMFLDEARLAAQLTAPGLVQVFDFGKADGGYFMVMEYVDGTDLGALLAGTGRLPPALVVYLGRQLGAALAELHQARDARSGEPLGVVHRDVSPGNVLVSVGGDVKLGDFGVAKARARAVRTERGSLKGKLAYMSPEQVRGDEVDGRADVYGLALVLFEALTGERYLTARDGASEPELLRAAERPIFRAPSSLCAGVPAALDAVLERALATEPQRRFPNATFFEEALAACAPGLDLSASRRELGVLVRAACAPATPAAAAAAVETAGASVNDAASVHGAVAPGRRPTHAEAPVRPLDAPRTELLTDARAPSRRAAVIGEAARRSRRWWLWLPMAAGAVAATALTVNRAGVPTASRPPTTTPDPGGRVAPAATPVAPVVQATPPLPEPVLAAPLPPPPIEAAATATASRPKPRARPRAAPGATDELAIPAVVAPPPTPAPPLTLAPGDARAALDDIARTLERRGVLRADAPALYRAHGALAARTADPGVSAAELERLRAEAAGLATDRAFIDAKLQRLDRALARRELPVGVRQELRRHSQKALSDSVSGRYDDANRELNEIARIVEQ